MPRLTRLLLAGLFPTASLLFTLPASAATFTFDGGTACADFTWNAGTRTLTCTPSGGGGTPPTVAPTNCRVTGPSTGQTGGQVTLSGTCENLPQSWQWYSRAAGTTLAAPVAGCSGSSCVVTAAADGSMEYAVVGSNSFGWHTSPVFTVAWSAAPPPPPPPGPITCTGWANTKVIDASSYPAPGTQRNLRTSQSGTFSNGASPGFGPNDIVVIKFTAPVADPNFKIGYAVDSGGANAFHKMSVSATACDFSAGALAVFTPSVAANLDFTSAGGTPPLGYLGLTGGATYYVNISNLEPGTSTSYCSGYSYCDVFITIDNAP